MHFYKKLTFGQLLTKVDLPNFHPSITKTLFLLSIIHLKFNPYMFPIHECFPCTFIHFPGNFKIHSTQSFNTLSSIQFNIPFIKDLCAQIHVKLIAHYIWTFQDKSKLTCDLKFLIFNVHIHLQSHGQDQLKQSTS